MLNVVAIMGRLVADPELRTTQSLYSLAGFFEFIYLREWKTQ